MNPHDAPPGSCKGRSRSLLAAFRNAGQGFLVALRSERNLQIHACCGGLAILLGWGLGLTRVEWCLVCAAIAGVITAELLNTALEKTLDRIAPELHPRTGQAKDIAAAGVAVASCGAVGIGLLLYGPRLYAVLLNYLTTGSGAG